MFAQNDTRRAAPGQTPGIWRVWVDTGGTFTDCIGVAPDGEVRRAKVLSTSAIRARVAGTPAPGRVRVEAGWEEFGEALHGMSARALNADGARPIANITGIDRDSSELTLDAPATLLVGEVIELTAPEEAPVLGARLLTLTPAGSPLPQVEMRLGTTRGTNALLERRGAPVAFFVTRGFRDLLEIGTQQRPDLFALRIVKPLPLHTDTVEVAGRLGPRGEELSPLNLDEIAHAAASLAARGVRSAAIALMHSWINPAHEEAVAAVLYRIGFEHVSLSSRLAPAIKVLPRAQTAVVNAYLSPMIEPYLRGVESALARGRVHVMTSGGGLVAAREFAPKDSLLSGPAGGLIGAADAGRAAGFDQIIALDMGGTSSDVSRFDGEHEYVFEHRVGDTEIVAPALAIESVAAGGGSVCWIDRGMLAVGPRSAGANPGPACYGAGGPLTITDCNLLLGRLDPAGFQVPISVEPARQRLTELTGQLERETGSRHDPDSLPEAWLDIALERMAEAMRRVSVRRGYNPASHALVAFGGAGGQAACGLASRLGITSIVIPPDAGLLSARGLGAARVERFAQRQVLRPLDSMSTALPRLLSELADQAARQLAAEGVRDSHVRRRIVSLRLSGQETTIDVESDADGNADALCAGFVERYVRMYGHPPAPRAIEVESVRVAVAERKADPVHGLRTASSPSSLLPTSHRRAFFSGKWRDTPIRRRESLSVGAEVVGPALILEAHTTTVVEPGWNCRLHESGALVMTRSEGAESTAAPPRIEVSTGRLAAIASDMGEMLRRTAVSTNVKERLDFSCAVLDADGRLVVNAPHVPVHLGSLGVCVRAVRDALPLARGDVAVTNHPAFGGSHLPDITVITPVFGDGDRPLAYVASRAHHAEIGGIRPGSMPVGAASLAEEGVVIAPTLLVKAGEPRWNELERLLRNGPYPSRAIDDNLADLRAQVAANRMDADAIGAYVQQASASTLADAMTALSDRADAAARRAISKLAMSRSIYEAEECLDDGAPIRVRIDTRPDGSAVIDFAGSASVHPGAFNATEAIVRSAVIYVLRLLVDEPVPLNEGLVCAIDIRIPHGMLSPRFPADSAACPAVAAGNVETSQRIVDTMLKALGLAACNQGTMNNLIFGNDRFGYYETICGGAGAGPGFDGADAVHTHMTNTRITDPETLEHRYPVRLDRFEVRRGSGGVGRWRGGDGVVRELTFLEPCSLSLITQHRTAGPYGTNGGSPGRPGEQRIIRSDGRVEPLASVVSAELKHGDRLVLRTPGGGGFGIPEAVRR